MAPGGYSYRSAVGKRSAMVKKSANKQRQASFAAKRVSKANYRRSSIRALQASILTKKGVDVDYSQTSVISTTNTNGNITLMNAVTTGAGSWNRVGRKIHMKSIRLQGFIDFIVTPTFATGVSTGMYVRMVLVFDKQPSGAAIPTFDAIFGITDQQGTESCPDVQCPPRYDNMDRFRVLMDKLIPMGPFSVPAFGSAPSNISRIPYDYFIKLGALETVYSNQTNPCTIADISSGSLLLVCRTVGDAANMRGNVDGVARLRYTD